MNKKLPLFPLFFLIIQSLILTVHADTEDVDISQFPSKLAEALNIPLFAGQLMASGLIMAFFLLPTLVLTRGKNVIAVIFMGFMAMSICIALTWLPYWILIVISLLIAWLYSGKISERF